MFLYDVVRHIVRQCQHYTMSYTMTNATSPLYDIEFYIRLDRTTSYSMRYDVRYGLPGAAGAAGGTAGRTGHVPAPPTAPAS